MLTIGIPTWNRKKELLSCLSVITNQLYEDKVLIEKVEVFVSDNNSSDETRVEVEKFISNNRLINFNYQRHDKNIGFDRNIDSIFKNSTGDFVWIFSDDDGLIKGAVKKVYNHLINLKNKCEIIFLNYNSYDSKLERLVSDKNPEIFKNIKENTKFSDYNKMFLKTEVLGFSMISSNIFNRKSWNNLFLDNFFNSNIIQCYVQIELYLKGAKIFIINDKIVKYRLDNNETRWTIENDNPFNLVYSAFYLLNYYRGKIGGKIFKTIYTEQMIKTIKGVLYNKTVRKLNLFKISNSFLKCNGYRFSTLVLIFFVFLPKSLIKLIYDLKKIILNRQITCI